MGQRQPVVLSNAQSNSLFKNNAFSTVFGTGGNEAGTFTLNRYIWGAVEAVHCIFFTNYSHNIHAITFTKKKDDNPCSPRRQEAIYTFLSPACWLPSGLHGPVHLAARS